MAKDSAAEAPTPTPATAGGNQAANNEAVADALGTPTTETIEAAAPAPGTTTAPKEGPGESSGTAAPQPRDSRAVDVESYERMKREALSPAKTPAEPAEAQAPVEPAAEETPAIPAEEPAEEIEELPVVEGKAPDRVRLGRLKDDGEKKRINNAVQVAADEGITFTEAWRRLNGDVPPAGVTGGANPPAPEEPAKPALRSRAEIDGEIKAKKEEKRKAASDLDTVKMLDLDDEIDGLKTELTQVERAEQEAVIAQQSTFERESDASAAEAVKYYPDSKTEGTALRNKIVEIADRLEATKNPLINQPDAPLRVAQMAANELGIAPADPSKPKGNRGTEAPPTKLSSSTATKPALVNQQAVGRPTQPAAAPASGAARTTHGNGQATVAIGPIRSVADYEAAKEKLGVRV